MWLSSLQRCGWSIFTSALNEIIWGFASLFRTQLPGITSTSVKTTVTDPSRRSLFARLMVFQDFACNSCTRFAQFRASRWYDIPCRRPYSILWRSNSVKCDISCLLLICGTSLHCQTKRPPGERGGQSFRHFSQYQKCDYLQQPSERLNATPLFWQTKRPPFFGKLNATGPTQGGAFTFSILIRPKSWFFLLEKVAFFLTPVILGNIETLRAYSSVG